MLSFDINGDPWPENSNKEADKYFLKVMAYFSSLSEDTTENKDPKKGKT